MHVLTVRLPDSLYQQLEALAEREGVSVDHLVTTAVAQKVSALLGQEYLQERAARGDRAAFEVALAQVADAIPEPGDSISGARGRMTDPEARGQEAPPFRFRSATEVRREPRREQTDAEIEAWVEAELRADQKLLDLLATL